MLFKTFSIILFLFIIVSSHLEAKETKTEPTNATELAAKKLAEQAEQTEINNQYATWKKTLPARQQAWETVLEENLGGFYFPRYKMVKMRGGTTAWDYVADNPKLPRILIIGDSISRGYTQGVRQSLKDKVNVHRAPANCGPTRMGLNKLDIWLGEEKWDLITFNFGIHDRKTETKTYLANLEKLIDRLKKTKAKLVWVTTTPIPSDSIYGSNDAIIEKNYIAKQLMQKHNIPQCDLYSWIHPDLKTFQNPKDCHFSGKGYNRLAQKVSKSILKELKRK